MYEIDFDKFDYMTAEHVISNADGIINKDVAEELKNNNCFSEYTAWNFHALIWYDKIRGFGCQVSQHHKTVSTFYRRTIEDIKKYCCENYGDE